MRRTLLIAGLTLLMSGCVSGPMLENPVPLLAVPPGAASSSPVFLPQSALGYPRVFEKCLDVVGSSTADSADIQQSTCGSGTNQLWSRTQV